MLLNKNKTPLLFLFLIIFSCSSWEFVYKDALPNPLKGKTEIFQNTTNSFAYQYLKQRLDNSQNSNYKLIVSFTKKTANLITKKDQTASKIEISYLISYLVKDKKKQCDVYNKKFKTNSYYNSKSSGYSFGTDLSKKNTEESVVKKNIDMFFQDLSNNHQDLNCLNES
tara:strand:- start:2582 stop:3085 length:504 start_codon:yes stop_codon:yes gene_type:complete